MQLIEKLPMMLYKLDLLDYKYGNFSNADFPCVERSKLFVIVKPQLGNERKVFA